MRSHQRSEPVAACLALALVHGILGLHASGQGTAEDFDRAWKLGDRYANTVTRDAVSPVWVSADRFWFRSKLGPKQAEFVLVDCERGERRLAFDHAAVAGALREHVDGEVDAADLPIDALWFDDAGQLAALKAKNGEWLQWRDEEQSFAAPETVPSHKPLEPWRPPRRRRRAEQPRKKSPDDRWEVHVVDGRLTLRDLQPPGGGEPVTHEKAAKPEGDRRFAETVYWAPDSSTFVAMEIKPGQGREIPLIESSPKGTHHGKLHKHSYTKPGDEIEQRWPRLFTVGDGAEIAVDRSLMENPWSIKEVRWGGDARDFTLLYNQRGHRVVRLLSVDAASGAVRAISTEEPETFVDYAHKVFTHYLDKTGEVVWMSERDGWNHLYLIDAVSGEVVRQLTRGPWVVRGMEHVDAEARTVTFRCGGIYGEQDPYYVHYARVNLDTGEITRLTAGDGTHTVQYSPDRRWLIDTYSRVDMPPVTELCRASDGAMVCELDRADAAALVEAGWRAPERFVAKGRDGKTDIYGVIYRPSDFDATKRYPVVEEHYAGPHGAHCPKAFRTVHRGQEMAELGFIVVALDGMGTSHRSKAFHDVCWKNLVDGGFPDRIAWIKGAARHEPAMDLQRVGIRGTSAGGQTGMAAVLHHGGFYKVCVSNCGCHDNRVDKIWWNELWMSWPIGPHYAEQSNVTNAHKLQRDLLLIVGEMDRNVDPISTLQVVDALVKADKDFEMLVIPGGGHGAGRYAKRRTWDFLVEKLHGVTPRR
ncbi:MAG: prolyl oligopeptidase family serine peptidase [Planctomycetota bacterium]